MSQNRNLACSGFTHGRTTGVTDSTGRSRRLVYQYCAGVAGGSELCTAAGAFRVMAREYRADGVTRSGPEEITIYDPLGRQIAHAVERLRDSMADLALSETNYDSLGRPYRNTLEYFYLSDGAPEWVTRTFDALGRVTTESYPDNSSSAYVYNGLTSSVTNGLSQTTTTELNAQGHIYRVTEPGSVVTEYAYNAAGDLLSVTDPAGNVTSNTVDARGRVVQRVDPDMGTWNYQYTVLDQLKQQTDAKSQTTTLSYDALGRLTEQVTSDLTSEFVYDSAANGIGLLDYMETSDGNRRSHTYDSYGRVISTTVRTDATHRTFNHSYNSDGRLATLSYPSGYQVSYEYTGVQRSLSALRETSTNDLLWRADERHANGQTTQTSLDGVVSIARQFDPLTGLLTDIQAGPNATPTTLVNISYDYDVLGNLTNRYDANEILSESFQYDNLNRLTQATTGSTVYTADYNTIGNITSKRRLGSSANNTYSYPATGLARPHAVSSVSGQINGVTNPSYNYDANGNMTSGAGRTLTWQSFNQVATVTEGATTLTYTYDAEHQRIKQHDGSNTIYYLNDPVSGASAEYHSASGGEWHDYLIVEGQRIGKRTQTLSPASVSHQRYIQDHLGSIALVLDDNGNLIQKMSYDVLGLRRFPDGSEDPTSSIAAPDSRGYTDHEHLPNSRLINMNARLYDPELGRFISADPFIPNPLRSQAYNRYSYVYNNPLRYTDPSGNNPQREPDCWNCPEIIVTPGDGVSVGLPEGWFSRHHDPENEYIGGYGVGGGVGQRAPSNNRSSHYAAGTIASATPGMNQLGWFTNLHQTIMQRLGFGPGSLTGRASQFKYSAEDVERNDRSRTGILMLNDEGLVSGLTLPDINLITIGLDGAAQLFVGIFGVSGSYG